MSTHDSFPDAVSHYFVEGSEPGASTRGACKPIPLPTLCLSILWGLHAAHTRQ
jgi:hypothetical protein